MSGQGERTPHLRCHVGQTIWEEQASLVDPARPTTDSLCIVLAGWAESSLDTRFVRKECVIDDLFRSMRVVPAQIRLAVQPPVVARSDPYDCAQSSCRGSTTRRERVTRSQPFGRIYGHPEHVGTIIPCPRAPAGSAGKCGHVCTQHVRGTTCESGPCDPVLPRARRRIGVQIFWPPSALKGEGGTLK